MLKSVIVQNFSNETMVDVSESDLSGEKSDKLAAQFSYIFGTIKMITRYGTYLGKWEFLRLIAKIKIIIFVII